MIYQLETLRAELFPPSVMKTCFTIDLGRPYLAIADVTYFDGEYSISRINVPEQFRGHGYGTQLLNQVLAEADAHGIELWLVVCPSGGLNHDQLRAWYMRHGFEPRAVNHGFVYIRSAQS